MTYDLSLSMPGIRTDLWHRVYMGLKSSSCILNTEVIFVGPYDLPESLKDKDDIVYIKDWGNANRCAQIALLNARGSRVLLASDDGYLLPGMLDHLYDTLDLLGERKENHIAVGKYIEGSGKDMDQDWYYYLNNHGVKTDGIDDTVMLGCYLLMDREWLLRELGGFNMIFEGSAMACHELAIRIQKFTNAKLKLSQFQIAKCDHMPGTSGDHGPMHYAQILHDEPTYKNLIPKLTKEELKVDPNDWMNSEAIWSRRFNNINLKYRYELINNIWRCIYE